MINGFFLLLKEPFIYLIYLAFVCVYRSITPSALYTITKVAWSVAPLKSERLRNRLSRILENFDVAVSRPPQYHVHRSTTVPAVSGHM